MDDQTFVEIVNLALESLPEEFKEKLDNVEVVVEDLPSILQMKKMYARGERGILLGLYEGIPHTRRGAYGIGGPLPDKITLFKINILRISRSPDDIKFNVNDTVIHEIGHHFGLTDAEIYKAQKNL